MNLTIQSERNLKLCISITSKSIDSDLSTEFKRMLDEVGYGKSLTEGLRDLMKRIPSKSVCNVILNIIEANEFGNSIEGALTNQINYLTDKRILDIKESINKMPMKISIVSVLLFLPLMMLLILGPIFINYILKYNFVLNRSADTYKSLFCINHSIGQRINSVLSIYISLLVSLDSFASSLPWAIF